MPERSMAADLGLTEALQARTRGFGSFTMLLRVAIATTASYLVAVRFSQSVLPIFAPATTLLVVQSSAFSTLGMLAQRVLGTGLGVAAATVYVSYVPVTWWSVFLAVLAAHQGDVVSKDELVDAVWKGRPVSDEVITRCISLIRRALGEVVA